MRAVTRRCFKSGHPEFEVEYDADLGIEEEVAQLLITLESAVAKGRIYRKGDSVNVGFAVLKVSDLGNGHLGLLEPDWSGINPMTFVPTVSYSLRYLKQQTETLSSLDPFLQPAFPSIRHTTTICSNFIGQPCGIMTRLAMKDDESGWYFGCDDPHHEHDGTVKSRQTSLYQIACDRPAIIPFLALPLGYSVQHPGSGETTVWHQGHNLPLIKGSYLERLLQDWRETTSPAGGL